MKKEVIRIRLTAIIFCFLLLLLHASIVKSISPNGGSTTAGSPQTAPMDSAGSAAAYAGNVTQLNIFGYSTTQTWQGYFGNVTGVIQLGGSNDAILYNWSLASPQGEVYASTNQTIIWTGIQCFNFTANASGSAGSPGSTNLAGTNLSALESRFNIVSDDVDGVDETFTLSGAGTHDLFYTANLQFSEGECRSTRIYDSSGTGVNNNFEEVLLYEPTTSSIVFASLLEQDQAGFNGATHDFELLVLEDGHGTDVATTTYYFYVELE